MSTDSSTPPAVQPAVISGSLQAATNAALDRLEAQSFSRRLWERDATLWKQDPEHQKIIRNALGWLTVADTMLKQLDVLEGFPQEVRSAGFTDQVLLGMGGSSLCPDVCRATFGTRPGFLQLHVLDSTDPASVAEVDVPIDLPARSLWFQANREEPRRRSVSSNTSITKSERSNVTGRERILSPSPIRERRWRHWPGRSTSGVFSGQPDIGGRYSALRILA